MFPCGTAAVLLIFATTALSAAATPSLSLLISGPGSVHGVSNLKLLAIFSNIGNETIRLLNDPRTVLHALPTDAFTIVHEESGAIPSFVGARVRYVPEVAAKIGGTDAFTALGPGANITIEHNLSAAYNFTRSAEGRYVFHPSNPFHAIDKSGAVVPIFASLSPQVHAVWVSGMLAVAHAAPARPHGLAKRATFNGCSTTQQTQLLVAAAAANSYAAESKSYLETHTATTPRYRTWFGIYTATRHSTVLWHFTSISSHNITAYKFDCTCTDSGIDAYVYPDTFGTVYLCGAFWLAPDTGSDSRAGILIRESVKFTANGRVTDVVYGQSAAKALAASKPDQAIDNADNYQYFAENTPPLA